jgi:hypothetical protein
MLVLPCGSVKAPGPPRGVADEGLGRGEPIEWRRPGRHLSLPTDARAPYGGSRGFTGSPRPLSESVGFFFWRDP